MWIKLGVWAAIAAAAGWILNQLLTPAVVAYAIAIYAIPIVALGFQTQTSDSVKRWQLFGYQIVDWKAKYRRLTWWGIPITEPEEIESEISVLEGLKDALPVLLSNILRRLLPGGRKALPGT